MPDALIDEWMNPGDVYTYLRRKRALSSVYAALNDGSLHGHQHGGKTGRWFIKRACVDAWIQNRDGRDVCGCRGLKLLARRVS